MKAALWFTAASVPLALLAALSIGSVELGPSELWQAVSGSGDEVNREIVWGLRLPRALAAFACGSLLALAGALLQVLLRNPLADPYLLGVSGGAATAALAAMLLGASGALLSGASALGAAAAALAIFVLSLAPSGWNPYRVLLAGVALSSGFGAIISLLLTVAPAAQVQGMLFWLFGDLSGASNPLPAWLVLAAVAVVAQSQAMALNVMTLGEDQARSLGVAVARVQWLVFGCATAATAAAVLVGGGIGFVGLVTPHLLRLAGVHDHRALLPASACLGGAFLAAADAVARSAASPTELPVGAVTALIGVPALLVLLAKGR
ncbi:MAG: ABC transporter permease [Betaproteobacteria bacterium RIFCSPLOWO2_02_FULL_65_24]|nr:MAG: ABC transporter permease [Betaproteobacteria bacterium RIFCSPLOWO2_02_FULL_65_24]OGA96910.1 MAG: ABC transporter permease [Betaproteobacteria bacterium RIFCSPLOWO2_12_FULL_66_14]